MATINLSSYDKATLPDAQHMRIGIVVSEWNHLITGNLLKGCLTALTDCGVQQKLIHTVHVPGSFELSLGAQFLLEKGNIDAVICLGCIIRGETPHFDFVSQACADGIQEVGLKYNVPVVFGVLTDDNIQQSLDRSGGSKGNKGTEAAITAIKMIELKNQLMRN